MSLPCVHLTARVFNFGIDESGRLQHYSAPKAAWHPLLHAALLDLHIGYCLSDFAPALRKAFLLHRCSWNYGYPFLVPDFRCLFVLCLFLDHFLFRGGQCCLYASSPLQQWLCKGNSDGLCSTFAILPSESTPHPFHQAAGGSVYCRVGVEWKKDFTYNWFSFDLTTLSPAEDLGGQFQLFSKIKSFGKETVMRGIKNKLPFPFPNQLAEMILNPFPVS